MSSSKLCLIGGGARSGKSLFAVKKALSIGDERVFLATAQAFDEEMRIRIRNHQAERLEQFVTVEAPFDVAGALNRLDSDRVDVVVIDCLTLWLSNLLLANESETQIGLRVEEVLNILRTRPYHALLVTNEVGMGIVPESKLGRLFRDIAGRVNQQVAREADEIYMALMGTILQVRPGTMEVRL